MRTESNVWERTRDCSLLYSILLVYLFTGGILFHMLEFEARDDDVQNATQQLDRERNVLISALWAETMAKSEEDWSMIANDRLDIYENILKHYLAQGIDSEYETDNEWNLIGSIFYCFTIVTTIGYGSPAPATACGKIGTIIYGLVGIPLALILLTEIGKLLTVMLKSFINRLRPSSCDDSDEFNFSPIIAVPITFAYFLLGACFFDWLQDDWGLVDSMYFSFVTFSTVGFGDINLDSDLIQLLIMIYTLGGLSLCSMCFIVIQQAIEHFISTQHKCVSDWWHRLNTLKQDARHKKNDEDIEDVEEVEDVEEEVEDVEEEVEDIEEEVEDVEEVEDEE